MSPATIVARAPGKLFVLGEYAILSGGRAVVAAVDRRAEVTLRRRSDSRVCISAPGLAASVEFAAGQATPPHELLRFALAGYHHAVAELPQLAAAGMEIIITNDLQQNGGAKTGLGSSAAVTAAVVAALFAAGSRDAAPPARERIYAVAVAAHRQAQGNVGSGADVAASVYGGVLALQPRPGAAPAAQRLPLPAGIAFLAGWSGEAASTPDLVRRYRAAGEENPDAVALFLAASRAAVDRFVAALEQRRLAAEALNAGGRALERLAVQLELPLLTPRLARLVSVARREGAGAKVSGAGGGDCGIALTADADAADRIRDAWRTSGITPLDLRISDTGVDIAHT